MNEVNSFSVARQLIPGNASSKGAGANQPHDKGKVLPSKTEKPDAKVAVEIKTDVKTEFEISTNTAAKEKAPLKTEEELESAVAKINDYVQSIQRDLQFSVDEDLNQTVIKVVDSESGNLIRQIPEDVFLELARNLNADGEFRLVNTLG